MAQPVKRDARLILRVSPSEKATLEERAGAEGLTVSEYIRKAAGVGHYGRSALMGGERKEAKEPGHTAVELRERERRVQEAARRMPKRNAERLITTEEARDRAKAALG